MLTSWRDWKQDLSEDNAIRIKQHNDTVQTATEQIFHKFKWTTDSLLISSLEREVSNPTLATITIGTGRPPELLAEANVQERCAY